MFVHLCVFVLCFRPDLAARCISSKDLQALPNYQSPRWSSKFRIPQVETGESWKFYQKGHRRRCGECVRRSIKESRGSVRPHDGTSYDVLCAELRRDAHSAFRNTKESEERPDSRSSLARHKESRKKGSSCQLHSGHVMLRDARCWGFALPVAWPRYKSD
jgi:hypothetical protein